MGNLTADDVEAARHDPAKARPVRIGDGDGLYLQVAPGGTKSWLFRFRLRGRSREMGLGAAGGAPGRVPLEVARALAAAARAQLRQGRDPIDERRAAPASAATRPANPPSASPLHALAPRSARTSTSLAAKRFALRRGLQSAVRREEAAHRPEADARPAILEARPFRRTELGQGRRREPPGGPTGLWRGLDPAVRRGEARRRSHAGAGAGAERGGAAACPPSVTRAGQSQERGPCGRTDAVPAPSSGTLAPPAVRLRDRAAVAPALAATPSGSGARAVEPKPAGPGEKQEGEKSRKVLALVSRLPDRDIAQAKAMFSPEGRETIAEIEALLVIRRRGLARRADRLVERAAELQEREGLNDDEAAARVLAEWQSPSDKACVLVDGTNWCRQRAREAVKNGLRRQRDAEARRLEAETQDRRERERARTTMRAALFGALLPKSAEAQEAAREAERERRLARAAGCSKRPVPTRHHIEAALEAAREINAARRRKPKP